MSTSAPPDSRTSAGPEGTAEGLPGPGQEDVAPLGALAQPFDVVEQPADLGAGEVRRERQAGLAAEAVLA
ncbi:hypothetical protein DLE01_08330, partial [Streptomyces sp. FT05W]